MVGSMTSGHSQTCVVTAKHMVTVKRVVTAKHMVTVKRVVTAKHMVTIIGMDIRSQARLPEVG